jgi:hypothetical protein
MYILINEKKMSKASGLELGTHTENFIELQPCFILSSYLRLSAEETIKGLNFVFMADGKLNCSY